jgi:outer membrane protein assembly factor BamB
MPRRGRRPLRSPSFQAQNPLIERIGKDAFNTISDLRAAVDGKAYREACQILVSMAYRDTLELVPDGDDPRLLTSLALAAEAEARSTPDLQKMIGGEFAAVGRLRLNQAAARGDAQAAETVCAEFPLSQVAGEAHRWLGDRLLSAGRFAEAAGHYRKAVVALPATEREALAARYRLVGALMGRELGHPAEAAFQIGGTALVPVEFERMIAGLKQAHESFAPPDASRGDALGGFSPGEYRLRSFAAIEGQGVKRPGGFPDKSVDWAGRQTAVLVGPRQLIVNNRLELASFDLESGQPQWSHRVDVEERNQQWPLVPMQPVPFGRWVLARRLTNDGPELVCLDPAEGKLVWTSKPDDYVASDPLVVDEKPLVLTASHDGPGKVSVFLVELNAFSGRARSRAPLVEFRNVAKRPLACQAAAYQDRIVATAAGCVLAFSPAGQMHWIRRQAWTPPAGLDYSSGREWFDQHHDRPLVWRGRVYATQPGVWGIECLELESGRLLWRQGEGELTRLAGITAGRLILATSWGPAALDPESGKPLWTREVKDCLSTWTCGPDGAVLSVSMFVERKGNRESPSGIQLSWFDPEDGRPLASAAIELPGQGGWYLGPPAAAASRQWLAMATRQQPTRRQIVEAIRVGDAQTP